MDQQGSKILVSDRTWQRMPDIRAKSEDALRKELELAGCHDIQFTEPRFQRIEPDSDAPLRLQFEPYWAWGIVAVGERDSPT